MPTSKFMKHVEAMKAEEAAQAAAAAAASAAADASLAQLADEKASELSSPAPAPIAIEDVAALLSPDQADALRRATHGKTHFAEPAPAAATIDPSTIRREPPTPVTKRALTGEIVQPAVTATIGALQPPPRKKPFVPAPVVELSSPEITARRGDLAAVQAQLVELRARRAQKATADDLDAVIANVRDGKAFEDQSDRAAKLDAQIAILEEAERRAVERLNAAVADAKRADDEAFKLTAANDAAELVEVSMAIQSHLDAIAPLLQQRHVLASRFGSGARRRLNLPSAAHLAAPSAIENAVLAAGLSDFFPSIRLQGLRRGGIRLDDGARGSLAALLPLATRAIREPAEVAAAPKKTDVDRLKDAGLLPADFAVAEPAP
ncbi:MAG TPA: hypothetical protein VGU20_14020 [Stellaceae bacterium]|nr:hypothetical protein [Stellaceae bacterium]